MENFHYFSGSVSPRSITCHRKSNEKACGRIEQVVIDKLIAIYQDLWRSRANLFVACATTTTSSKAAMFVFCKCEGRCGLPDVFPSSRVRASCPLPMYPTPVPHPCAHRFLIPILKDKVANSLYFKVTCAFFKKGFTILVSLCYRIFRQNTVTILPCHVTQVTQYSKRLATF